MYDCGATITELENMTPSEFDIFLYYVLEKVRLQREQEQKKGKKF